MVSVDEFPSMDAFWMFPRDFVSIEYMFTEFTGGIFGRSFQYILTGVYSVGVDVVFVQSLQDDDDDNMEDGIKLITSILGPDNIHLYPNVLQLVMADGAYTEGKFLIRNKRQCISVECTMLIGTACIIYRAGSM